MVKDWGESLLQKFVSWSQHNFMSNIPKDRPRDMSFSPMCSFYVFTCRKSAVKSQKCDISNGTQFIKNSNQWKQQDVLFI